ncbi:MAG: metal-dependent hydrolase [Myxococcales bacterium]
MYPLGHLGIGIQLVPRRLREGLRFRWLALGCLLPDLVDKPVFFWMQETSRGRHPSRLFGHTLLFWALLVLAERATRSTELRAVVLGTLTHLFLDGAGELVGGTPSSSLITLFWPLFGPRFPIEGLSHHMGLSEHALYLAGELAGAALLLWELARSRRARKG